MKNICGFLLLLLGTASAGAQGFPMIVKDPVASRSMDREMFEFLTRVLGEAKMAHHLKCTLKVRVGKELRRFVSGEEWTAWS